MHEVWVRPYTEIVHGPFGARQQDRGKLHLPSDVPSDTLLLFPARARKHWHAGATGEPRS